MSKHHCIIYMYTFPNGKKYIGQTKRTLKERQNYKFNGYRQCTALWDAIQKYGVENIKEEILFEGEMEDSYADRLEQICILLFKTNCSKFQNPSYGYNLTDGGSNYTQDTFDKLSSQRKGMKRKPFSKEHREKLSESHKGRNTIPDDKRKIITDANQRKVKATNIYTGNVIIFDSRRKCGNYFGVKDNTVTNWLIRGSIPSKTKGKNKHNEPWNYKFENYTPATTEASGTI